MNRAILAVLALAASAHAAAAHALAPGGAPDAPHDLAELAFAFEPGVVIPLLLALALWAAGALRMRGTRDATPRAAALAFLGGWALLALALVTPIHPLGQALFSAHMVQHELLMLGAAPLLVLARPTVAFLRAVPPSAARSLVRVGERFRFLVDPLAAWLVHAIVLWAWHAPGLFERALHEEPVHALQHVSFLAAALLFWEAVLHGERHGQGVGVALGSLFTTALHTTLLGVLLTFARAPWYPSYAATAPAWGMSALDDQQLGGLVMWIPGGLVYTAAGLVLLRRALRVPETEAA